MKSSNNDQDPSEEEKDSMSILWVLFGIIFLLWLANLLILYQWDKEARGTFGDMFGGANALFSGLALAGIIYTILLQKKELGLQRKELRDTRKEFEIQNETLKQQRFENTLFHLVDLHHEITDKLRLEFFREVYGGRNALPHAVKKLYEWSFHSAHQMRVDDKLIKIKIKDLDHSEKLFLKGYQDFYFNRTNQALSHYFRNIYHIFKYIYTSNLIEEDKKIFYGSLVRAQLSSDELLLLFYNCLVPKLGYPKFLWLVRYFDIMQNFDTELLYKPTEHFQIYSAKLASLPEKWKDLKEDE